MATRLGQHFGCLERVIALTWTHILATPLDELDRCCELQ
jgi:hypothetical protein